MENKDLKKVASDIYAEVNAILNNHNASEELHDDIEALFADGYGADTAPRLVLDRLTWAEIAEVAASGDAPRKFRVGDAKTVELLTGEKIEVVILGFNHDVLSGTDADETAAISFGMRGVLDGLYNFNNEHTNRGGWRDSKMRNVYMERFYNLLPVELQNLIKPVVKLTGTGGGSNDVTSTDDKLFLLSQVEVTGDESYVASGEGVQYDYFKRTDDTPADEGYYANCDPEKIVKLRGGSAYGWWLRSPGVTYSTYFRYVYSGGGVYGYAASASYGVSFGFCI